MGKRTDSEIRADLAAKIAKIDEREKNRSARSASKDVRRMEADLRVLDKLIGDFDPEETLGDVRSGLRKDLEGARAAAVKP